MLGSNDNRPNVNSSGENLVLIVRGDILKKYPNTVIYAVKGKVIAGETKPDLPEYTMAQEPGAIKTPIFSGTLSPDITFLGFELTREVASGGDGSPGWYFVIEERVSEARFGFDLDPASSLDDWDDLSWGNFSNLTPGDYLDGTGPDDGTGTGTPVTPSNTDNLAWGDSSADIAAITMQKPVRIIIHADQMLP